MRITNDYRLHKDDDSFSGITEKKKVLCESDYFKNRSITIYEQISKKKNIENEEFRKIYNCKCALCGLPLIHFVDLSSQVDHFNPKKKRNEKLLNKEEQLSNLVFTCSRCNNGKQFMSKTNIKEKYFNILNPDNNIKDVFIRNEKYEIIIDDHYKDDDIINEFYKKMYYGNTIMRFCYMITILEFEKERTNSKEIKEKYNNYLEDIKKYILKKRTLLLTKKI